MTFKEFLLLIILVLFLIFVVQNTQAFPVKFLIWSFSMSRALWLILGLLVGLSLGWVLTLRAKKKKDELKSQKEKN
ncbi:MAG: hypothetical protein RBG1_1C00001G1197 [candidate division Zixibacteria bacterium RBG-1]|nr:MAG: hypothetical protein RBG1_1C00001G1197 [candidate division Zixibacteria bacterium RBG-1]OGC84565.1 MAG: hypothetical protein A2V73_02070 [candidate division Zixibacteria bacterium RBG_19FT_COMBO_42_43]